MATTTIEWTATRLPDGTVLPGYTFNPWRGCKKVSPACAHCYAEALSKRNPRTLGSWEAGQPRVMAAESYMRRPFLWNAAAEKSGIRMKVFCSSLADVFEEWTGPVAHVSGTLLSITLDDLRKSLLGIIDATPSLDWLLLTKRPENVTPMLYRAGRKRLPANVWLGTTVEDQTRANERIPRLLEIPASVRFLSCEPLLGPVDLNAVRHLQGTALTVGEEGGAEYSYTRRQMLHWVIAGGESGSKARPSHPDWFRSLRDQCHSAGIPFFFKQWGEHLPICFDPPGWQAPPDGPDWHAGKPATVIQLDGSHRREFPPGAMTCVKIGKKAAGRLLDGVEWNHAPEPAAATLT